MPNSVTVALDPGVTTGICSHWDIARPPVPGSILNRSQLDTGEPEGLNRMMEFLNHLHPDVVVYERFVYQKRDKVELWPVQVIGVINYWCWINNRVPYVQTPSQAKNLWPDEKLKKLGLWIEGQPHAMDATRHMLYHLVVSKGDRSWLENLRPPTVTSPPQEQK